MSPFSSAPRNVNILRHGHLIRAVHAADPNEYCLHFNLHNGQDLVAVPSTDTASEAEPERTEPTTAKESDPHLWLGIALYDPLEDDEKFHWHPWVFKPIQVDLSYMADVCRMFRESAESRPHIVDKIGVFPITESAWCRWWVAEELAEFMDDDHEKMFDAVQDCIRDDEITEEDCRRALQCEKAFNEVAILVYERVDQ